MNRAYLLVWNEAQHAWVPAPETARAQGKSGGLRTLVAAMALVSGSAFALPTGGSVNAGQGVVSQTGSTLTISQQSQKLSLNWNTFNIAGNETVNFLQPDSSAIALNRVLGNDASQIYGHLNANGQVFLINPNGLLFGQGAQVNVGGLVASTLNISDKDFNAGNYHFSGSAGSITNQGSISAADGGYIALLGGQVSNQGTITARLGSVSEAAGADATLDFNGDGLLSVQVNAGTLQALAENKQLIQADGGHVLLTAKAADSLAIAVVNNSGVIEAETISNKSGVIELLADENGGAVVVSGTLDASAPVSGNGGNIETSGASVRISDGSRVTALAQNGSSGNWLIDPQDYTVGPGGDMSGSMLSTWLANFGNTTIQSSAGAKAGSGDITINDAVSWGSHNLILTADNNININGVLTAGGTAGLIMTTGSSGAVNMGLSAAGFTGMVNFTGFGNSLTINGQAYTIIISLGVAGDATVTTLQGMQNNLDANYALGANIDASATSGWNSGAGFAPVAFGESIHFTGNFNGLGHTISGLYINRPDDQFVGLFGNATTSFGTSSSLSNVGFSGASITGSGIVGTLAASASSVSNVLVTSSTITGSVSGSVGGVVSDVGYLTNTYVSNTAVSGLSFVGGAAGEAGQVQGGGVSSVTVTGSFTVGGFAGIIDNSLSNVSASAVTVSGDTNIGGLVGDAGYNQISNSYVSSGKVSGSSEVGGLFGTYGQGASNLVNNAWYDIDKVSINSAAVVAAGALYDGQFQAWLSGGMVALNVQNYGSSLAYDSSTNAYTISTVQGMKDLLGFAGGAGLNFELGADIDLASLPGYNIPFFSQLLLDGAGHVISNASVSQLGGATLGFVGTLASGSTISNLGMKNITVTGGDGSTHVGGLVGTNNGTLTGDYVASGTISGGSYVGGLAGYSPGTLTNDYASSTKVTGSGDYVGGLAGETDGIADDVHVVSATVSGAGNYVGGLFGVGYTVSNAYVSTSSVSGGNFVGGLLGENLNEVTDVYVTGGTVNGSVGVGGLLGANNYLLSSSHVTGTTITSSGGAGALVGENEFYINSSYAENDTVSGDSSLGGLVGVNDTQGSVTGYASSVKVLGSASSDSVGGLVGKNVGTAFLSYVLAGTVSGQSNVGGLVGSNSGSVEQSYVSAGSVSGSNAVGGVVGNNNTGGRLSNSYALSSTVSGANGGSYFGGLVGQNSGTVQYDYVAGQIVSGAGAASLVAYNDTNGQVLDSFWDSSSGPAKGVGQNLNASGLTMTTGLTATQMRDASTYTNAGWVIADSGGADPQYVPWRIYSGQSLPLLLSFLRPLTVTANDQTITYDATAYSGGNGVTYSATPQQGEVLGTLGYGGSSQGSFNVGPTVITPTGLYSGQTGYDISFVSGMLMTMPAGLELQASSDTKTYDGTTFSTATGKAYGLQGKDSVIDLSESFDQKNALGNNNSFLTITGAAIVNDGNGGNNYIVSYTGATGTIKPLTLTLSYLNASSKVYDTTIDANVTAGLGGLINGDDVSAAYTASFSDANAGNGKKVTVTAISLSGDDAGNYFISSGQTATASISPATLFAQLTGQVSKTYDATTTATLSSSNYGLFGVLGNDSVTLNKPASGQYVSKNAGGFIPVSVSGLSLSGSASGNYQLADTSITGQIGFISPAVLSVTAVSGQKVYDGSTSLSNPVFSYTVLGNDQVSVSGTAKFTKKLGLGQTLTVTNLQLGGADGSNYALANTSIAGTGNITAAPLFGGLAPLADTYTAPPETGTGSLSAREAVAMLQASLAASELRLQGKAVCSRDAGTEALLTIQDGGVKLP